MSKLHYLIGEYIEKYYPLFGPKKVSEKLNMKPECITAYAKRNGLTLTKIDGIGVEIPDFKENLDFSSRFEKIDNKLAYWIGFMWADGCINHHSSMVIEIIEKDGVELSGLFQQIYPFTITKRKRRNKKAQIKIRVNDKKIGTLLESLGKYFHSCESHKKIFDYLGNEELRKHFLRGLIDGDGSFYWNQKEKYGQFTLASNYNQDWSFLLKYLKDFNPHVAKDIDENGKSSVLRITGRENIIKFITFLDYESNDIGLKRKIDNAITILNGYKENPSKKLPKHVFQYSKDGNFIKEFISAEEAGKAVGVKTSAIGNCLCGLSRTSGGFIWKYN